MKSKKGKINTFNSIPYMIYNVIFLIVLTGLYWFLFDFGSVGVYFYSFAILIIFLGIARLIYLLYKKYK